MDSLIDVYVELLDEGVETWRPTKALRLGDGLFRLLEPPYYDPEDELWDFLPGSVVRLRNATFYTGTKGLLAIHPDPKTIRIFVESSEEYAPPIRETYAHEIDHGLYQVLPTPHYTPAQLWKFPPESIVRLKKVNSTIPELPDYSYFLAVEKV